MEPSTNRQESEPRSKLSLAPIMHKSVTFELPPTFEIPPTCQGTKDRRIGRLRRRSTEYATYGSQSRGWSGRPEMRTFDITEANDNCLPLQLSGSESSSPDQVSSHTSDKALAGDLFISADATMRTLDEGDWTSFARSHYPRSYKSHQSTHPGITFCPDCKCPTIHEPPSVVAISGVCDNRKWQWIGEPPFCCVCASRRGLGKV